MSTEGEQLFAELLRVAGPDAERDLYYDETSGVWDLDGLRSDLEVYLGSDAPATASPALLNSSMSAPYSAAIASHYSSTASSTPPMPPSHHHFSPQQFTPSPQTFSPPLQTPQMRRSFSPAAPPPSQTLQPQMQKTISSPHEQPYAAFSPPPPPQAHATFTPSTSALDVPSESFDDLLKDATPLDAAPPQRSAVPPPLAANHGSLVMHQPG